VISDLIDDLSALTATSGFESLPTHVNLPVSRARRVLEVLRAARALVGADVVSHNGDASAWDEAYERLKGLCR